MQIFDGFIFANAAKMTELIDSAEANIEYSFVFDALKRTNKLTNFTFVVHFFDRFFV